MVDDALGFGIHFTKVQIYVVGVLVEICLYCPTIVNKSSLFLAICLVVCARLSLILLRV